MMTKINHLYIHVPFCNSICFYCDFCHRLYSSQLVDKWLNQIEKEINNKSNNIKNGSINKNTVQKKNINVWEYLNNNDAYNALNAIDGLIITGPTGTNVNDVSVLLIK